MIPLSGPLTAFLASNRNVCVADLWTFNLLNGTVLRYTTAGIDITFGGTIWVHGLRIERGKIKLTIGTQVDSLQVDCYPASTDMVGGNTFAKLAVSGGLDGCYVQLDRAFLSAWNEPVVGIVPKRFYGRVADVQGGRSKLSLTIKSDLDLLNLQMPRTLFQPACSHSLYDGGCTLVKSVFTVTGTVSGSGGTLTQFNTSLSQVDQYFTLGVISFTSGANTALSRSVKAYLNASGQITLTLPLPSAPADGDAFTIYPGCDKTAVTCLNKFSNLPNFRGFPYVPNPEQALL